MGGEHRQDFLNNMTNIISLVPPDLDAIPPQFSDDALALRFTAKHADELRYIAKFGQWFRWQPDGENGLPVWREDDTLNVYDLVRRVCRAASNDAEGATSKGSQVPKGLASGKTAAAVEKVARSDRRHAATIDQWDAEPWFLNTPDGIFDLARNELIGPWSEGYCTKVTAAPIDFGLACPLWLAFLTRVTGGDEALIDYLQRVCGYCLTGSTRDHALFFLYGTGANGKSVFINTISGVMSDYHRSAPIEIFMESKSDRHPTELAMLRGARLVTAVETEEGRRWAESRIKTLTGGDRIAARFMRQDYFEFTPQFKLMIAGNHKPALRTVDEAIRRRLNLIPFTVTIPLEERDPNLTEKLRAEWPGILAWMVAGTMAWQISGLKAPPAVRVATDAYLDAEDALAAWISDCCEREAGKWQSDKDLYGSYVSWTNRTGEHATKRRHFLDKLEDRGIGPHKTNEGNGHKGLRIVIYGD